MKKGLFITFEGPEGSGKSTQIKAVAKHLIHQGIPICITREPGGCPIADQIRSVLLNSQSTGMTPTTELLLFAAARRQHVNDVILPALEEGKIVLCDRFSDSTYAYQVFGRGLSSKLYKTINSVASLRLSPDITFLLDLPVSVGLERALGRNGDTSTETRFDDECINFHEKVGEGFRHLARTEPARFCVVNALDPTDSITNTITTKIAEKLG